MFSAVWWCVNVKFSQAASGEDCEQSGKQTVTMIDRDRKGDETNEMRNGKKNSQKSLSMTHIQLLL